MDNNDVLRRLRYTFDFNDKSMMKLFAEGGIEVTRAEVSAWLKRDDDEDFAPLNDTMLARFLNGLIIQNRGRRDGPQPEPEPWLTNNLILMKLKIALSLQAEEVLDLITRGGLRLSKHELSAFFRKPDHKHYRECKDQVLRHFLKALQDQHRSN